MDYRELGIGIVPYSPIGRGFFAGRGVTQQVSSVSSLVQTKFSLELISWPLSTQFHTYAF